MEYKTEVEEGKPTESPEIQSVTSADFWDSEIVTELLNDIDIDRWFSFVYHLVRFNRFSIGQEIHDAKDWIVSEMKDIPGMEVETHDFVRSTITLTNVIGILKGTEHPENIIIIGAHYDSTSEHPLFEAPGAVDNATGTAAVLEIASVFAKHKVPVTLYFILYAGEEQGYWGSQAHVNEKCPTPNNIKMMLNIDMIGWDNPDGNLIEIETNEPYSGLAKIFSSAAEKFCTIPPIISLQAWGSDHLPYLNKQIPGILTTNRECTKYPQYHTSLDTLNNVSQEVSRDFLRMDVATLAFVVFGGVDPRSL